MWHWLKWNRQLRMMAVIHLTCLLTFCLILGWLQLNLRAWSFGWLEKNLRISLFLSENISPPDTQALQEVLEQDERIQAIKKFSSEESFLFLQQQMPLERKLLENLDPAFLPTTLDFQIAPNFYHQVPQIVRFLQSQEGVAQVIVPQPIFEMVGHFSQISEPLAWGLFFVANLLMVFILFYLLRLAFEEHREAFKLLDLSGAPFFSIRVVFLLEVGMVLGISTLLSCGITFICYRFSLNFPLFQKASFFFKQPILFYEWQTLLVFGIFTFVLGQFYTFWVTQRWYLYLRKP